ncbi:acyl-CoA dehydrogenase family protein [Streptomyces olivochromogenes]|uniref:acyl-CoA dehydrogenase family protein n=1 Tax=Streptomyces olivochromogenes TaxID=1963 RepID=UPI001F477C30|nr:acyl-CoA dehydrogenase family protein [Streptomyces olivochromogenes]MCF3129228.1 acyl-CoA dehydrogenase [Streptomyces olivochromogenes]
MNAEPRDAAALSLAAARRAGLFAMAVPRCAGGAGAGLRTQVRVIAKLGRGCPSTAWIAALSAALKSVCSPVFPKEARAVLFADPDAVVCGSTTPVGAEGERTGYGVSISGRWRAVAGCEDAAWAVLAVPVRTRSQLLPPCPVLISTRDLTVERTAPTNGMAGTGSHTLVAQDVVVPTTHVMCTPSEAAGEPAPPGASAALLGMVVLTLAPLLGAARGALCATEEGWTGTGTGAARLVDSATRRALHVAGVLDALGKSPSLPSQEHARLRSETMTATQECREAVEKLLDLHGVGDSAPDVALRRLWRDVVVITRHPRFSPHTVAEHYGRVLFGPESGAASVV